MTVSSHDLARQLAVDSIRCTTAAGSGHPTSSMSAADLMAVLLTRFLRFDLRHPDHPGNDRLVLSKGHAAPLLYAALRALGVIDEEELLALRTPASPLEGHPVPGLPLIDVATGALGLGLAHGLGMALGLRRLGSPGRVWVLTGDSEMAEGAVWEAMASASYHAVDNLVCLVDMNRLGQTGPTMYGWDADVYLTRSKAFGWKGVTIDGHDHEAIENALGEAEDGGRPTMVVARTVKGHGVSFLADREDMHGKALDEEEAERAVEELGGRSDLRVTPPPAPGFDRASTAPGPFEPVAFDGAVSTRQAFGEALARQATARWDLMVLDGEVSNSTKTEEVASVAPDRFVQMFIAEQAMVGAAVGLQAVGMRPVAATFGAFLTRAHDVIRMAAISRATLLLCGSHAGVSIGEDGPSQMALDDLAMLRALPGTTVLYPCDGNATARLLEQALALPGITYLRTTRGETPQLYAPDHRFPIGGSHTLRSSMSDVATVVTAGITVFEALEAADRLEGSGTPIRVIDAYSVKPLDRATIRRAAEETRRLVVVEDHAPVGGLGDAVLEAVADIESCAVHKLAVNGVPGSADPSTQLDLAGLSAPHIVGAVQNVRAETVR